MSALGSVMLWVSMAVLSQAPAREKAGAAPPVAPAPAAESPAQRYFTDVELVDQDGEKLRLYSDLLKGKVVVINAFFTHCQGSCPVMGRTFSALQAKFGERIGKDLFLISISVDPEEDTPARLKAWAERFKARRGWSFVSGNKDNVHRALARLGMDVQQREGHSNLFIVGNEATGLWKKLFGLSTPEDIARSVEEVLDDRG